MKDDEDYKPEREYIDTVIIDQRRGIRDPRREAARGAANAFEKILDDLIFKELTKDVR